MSATGVEMDEARKQRLLQGINRKGLAVATKLADLKAGKDADLRDFELTGWADENLPKEKKLRLWLDSINGARRRLLDGDGSAYGRCLTCGAEIEPHALDDVPWLERRADCGERSAAPECEAPSR